MITAHSWIEALKTLGDENQRQILSRFFKTGPGEYGEGDLFYGIRVPEVRKVGVSYSNAPYPVIAEMLAHPVHECRLSGLLALVERYRRAKKDDAEKRTIVEFYLSNSAKVNNWDLVDLSAPKILGKWIVNHPEDTDILFRLSKSDNLWQQRIAVVSTWQMIHDGIFTPTLVMCRDLIDHKHDLIHKATGWMLREIGKRDTDVLCDFLDEKASEMPRTMLRYAIERLPDYRRQHYMNLPRKHKFN